MIDKEAGIKTSNQAYRKFEQVSKTQDYSLTEGEREVFDESYQIRTCDLGLWMRGTDAEKAQFAQDFGGSMEEIGFTVLSNHGIDLNLFKEMEAETTRFFDSISKEDRKPYHAKRHGSVNQGYFPIKETSIIHPDLVEGWVFCRRAFNLDNNPDFKAEDFWPDVAYEPKFRKLIKAYETLVKPIMQSVLTYLKIDPHCYDDKLTGNNFGFRLNYYPALKGELGKAPGGRMLGHEDVDLFTILPASSQEGLQVLNRKSGKWIRLNPPEGAIIINTGDYMQRITNNIMPSTTHRVAQPNNAKSRTEARISLPMAVYVWEDEILEVLPGLGEALYEPIRAEDFHTKITSKYYGDDYRPEDQQPKSID